MGYVREKYTREYFLRQDANGNKTNIGVEGLEEFLSGDIRKVDKNLLGKIDFKDKIVVDFGFGRGEAIKYICEQGAKKVYGVDFSKASIEIASSMLEHYGHRADLECSDALEYMQKFVKSDKTVKFDVVIMFDFVEHISRSELGQLLSYLRKTMSEKGLVVINTPIYKSDNDVIKEGLKEEARDASDEMPQTEGMHCNRYTKKSLIKFMKSNGFNAISPKFFSPSFKSGFALTNAQKWSNAKRNLFPVQGRYRKDSFEKALTSAQIRKMGWKKVFSPAILPIILPPAFFILKNRLFPSKKVPIYSYNPIWHKIKGGALRGKWFYIDTHDNSWQQEIIEGTYDKFFFDFLKKYNLEGKTIFDVGAFVGSHSLAFAQMVGKNGKVFSFEPNEFNISRMKKIFNRNKDLGKRIKIVKVALSDKNGSTVFSFSNQIDNGFSSGGFVEGSDTPREEAEYEKSHFKKCSVKSVKLDDLEARMKIKDSPLIIKIDTEGAEGNILESGQKYLKKHKPIILVEIHSPENMIHTVQVLSKLGYEISILKKEIDGRVFLSANPDIKNKSYAEIYPKN